MKRDSSSGIDPFDLQAVQERLARLKGENMSGKKKNGGNPRKVSPMKKNSANKRPTSPDIRDQPTKVSPTTESVAQVPPVLPNTMESECVDVNCDHNANESPPVNNEKDKGEQQDQVDVNPEDSKISPNDNDGDTTIPVGSVKPGDVPSYAAKLKAGSVKNVVNFRKLETSVTRDGVDIVLPKESVRVVQDRFANTLFGYFLGDRLAYPVVEYYAKVNWSKFGLQRVMMNADGFFFFKFNDKTGMLKVLEGGPWIIRSMPIFLNAWTPTAKLKKEDIKEVVVWVKIHNVPIAAYTDDGLSLLATKLGNPKMLDSYTTTMCTESWGRSSYARALIEISAENEFRDALTIAIPDVDNEQYVNQTMRVEYEWRPQRCATCCIFGHHTNACPKRINVVNKPTISVDKDGFTEVKGRKKGNKTGFPINKQKTKMVYRQVENQKPKKDIPSTSGTKENDVKTSNSFGALNDDDVISEKNKTNSTSKSKFNVTLDSDGEEVIEIFDNETANFMASGTYPSATTGASTPASRVSNG